MKDTDPEINRLIFERTMAKTPAERFLMGMSMLATARKLVMAGLPADLSEDERRRLYFERFYGKSMEEVLRGGT